MASIVSFVPRSGTGLLARILDEPLLVEAVRSLPAPALASLIEHVGLEDAGELVSLASSAQLAQLFDEDLWQTSGDEPEEQFDMDRFALWLAVMQESGDAFVAEHLARLPEDLLALAVQRAALVLDMDAVTRLSLGETEAELADKALDDALHEPWEEFLLVARDARHWDVVWPALMSLDRDHHGLLRRVLERCAWTTSARIEEGAELHGILSEEALLHAQVGEARDERRAARGYVSTADAQAFLRLADSAVEDAERDAITRAYFRRLAHEPADAAAPPSEPVASGAAASSLRELLLQAGVLTEQAASRRMLGAGTAAEAGAGLRELLPALAETSPERHAEILETVSYLANVVLAAARRRGSLRPVEALECAVSVCDVALRASDDPVALCRDLPTEKLFLRGLRALRRGEPGDLGRVPDWLL